MRIRSAVSTNYLERIADPEAPFHRHYLAYKNRQITRAELIRRLPHVAMIGDSLSRNTYVSSPLATAWRAHTARSNGWFVNTEPNRTSIHSLFEKLNELTPVVATEYGGMGAMLGGDADRLSFFRKLLRTRNFSEQVDRVMSSKPFPDLILIWIGHNNVDWTWWCPKDELCEPEARLGIQRKYFQQNYRHQVQRLIACACRGRKRVGIVAYGLADFASFFIARDAAEALRQTNRNLYPKLGADVRYFVSMRPEFRKHLIELVAMVNDDLCQMANELQGDLATKGIQHVQVCYSDALAKVDLSRVEMIHPVDGWHPSAKCHNAFAEAAYRSLGSVLEFVRLTANRSDR